MLNEQQEKIAKNLTTLYTALDDSNTVIQKLGILQNSYDEIHLKHMINKFVLSEITKFEDEMDIENIPS